MNIHLNAGDGVPIYLQIVNQVKYLVAAGRLAPGEELEPIRVLAERLVINPNTVARAYRELEKAGVVCKRSTTGTFVSASPTSRARTDSLALLADRVDLLLADARKMNIAWDELIGLLQQRYQVLQSSARESQP